MQLTPKERLVRQARGQEVDLIPTIGGWMNGPRVLAELAGISVEQYLSDPIQGVITANRRLNVDAMVAPAVPQTLDEVRTGHVTEADFSGIEPEALKERAESLPDSEREVLSSFDYAAEEHHYRDYFETAFRTWQGIQPLPNFWEIGGHFPLYTEFGYTAFLTACALYPEHVGKIWWAKSLHSRERARILARLFREYDLVPMLFCGEDLANNQGPMVSPVFLRQQYLPTVKMIIEPLVNIGIRMIHHCDGDIRPLIDDYIAIGFSGFQGFQYELGLDIRELRKLRSAMGEELLFLTGLSVSRTLPFGAPQDLRDEVDYFVDCTDGGQGMFLFTSNVTGVEVPASNIRTAYEYAHSLEPRKLRVQRRSFARWPWADTHGN
ncbi:MAG TPA: hypothetical protein VGK81_10525 [Anaerolineae bacterium]